MSLMVNHWDPTSSWRLQCPLRELLSICSLTAIRFFPSNCNGKRHSIILRHHSLKKKECKQDSERAVKRVTPSSRSWARILISPKKKIARNKTRSKLNKKKEIMRRHPNLRLKTKRRYSCWRQWFRKKMNHKTRLLFIALEAMTGTRTQWWRKFSRGRHSGRWEWKVHWWRWWRWR